VPGLIGLGRGEFEPGLLAGWAHHSFAGAGFELPTVVGLEAVVVGAEPVEVGELGDVDLVPVDAVVDLEMLGGGTPLVGAADVEEVEDGLLAGGGAPAEVGDVEDVASVGDDEVDGGVGQEGP
jgi:hypothetical protein